MLFVFIILEEITKSIKIVTIFLQNHVDKPLLNSRFQHLTNRKEKETRIKTGFSSLFQ